MDNDIKINDDIILSGKNGNGFKMIISNENPHLGGNIYYGDPSTFCPQVWDYVIQRFAIKSVLDLGSGEGYSAAYFHSKGLLDETRRGPVLWILQPVGYNEGRR